MTKSVLSEISIFQINNKSIKVYWLSALCAFDYIQNIYKS